MLSKAHVHEVAKLAFRYMDLERWADAGELFTALRVMGHTTPPCAAGEAVTLFRLGHLEVARERLREITAMLTPTSPGAAQSPIWVALSKALPLDEVQAALTQRSP